jgi:hypothetical protein
MYVETIKEAKNNTLMNLSSIAKKYMTLVAIMKINDNANIISKNISKNLIHLFIVY